MNERKNLSASARRKSIPVLILTFALLLLSLSACGAGQEPAATEAPAPDNGAAPVEETVEPAAQTPAPEPEVWDGSFETPVGALQFPAELAPEVELQDLSDDEQFALAFSAKVGEEKVELFKLLVGGHCEAYCLGSAPDADHTMLPVFVDIRQVQPEKTWTLEEVERVNLLQSSVNELIDQIYELPGFDPELLG